MNVITIFICREWRNPLHDRRLRATKFVRIRTIWAVVTIFRFFTDFRGNRDRSPGRAPGLPTLTGPQNNKGDADAADQTDAANRSESRRTPGTTSPDDAFDNGTPIGFGCQSAPCGLLRSFPRHRPGSWRVESWVSRSDPLNRVAPLYPHSLGLFVLAQVVRSRDSLSRNSVKIPDLEWLGRRQLRRRSGSTRW